MKTELLEIINTILLNRGKKQMESISENMTLRNDLEFDSLDLAELTVRLEVKYGVDIFEEGIVNTVEEVLARLSEK